MFVLLSVVEIVVIKVDIWLFLIVQRHTFGGYSNW